MGKKKKRGHELKPWCWYCDRTFDDEKVLIDHQRAKHLKCNQCNKRLNTAGGLVVHCQQVHKFTLTKLENTLPGRESVEIEIFGMEGVPEADLQAHIAQVTGNSNKRSHYLDTDQTDPEALKAQLAAFQKQREAGADPLLGMGAIEGVGGVGFPPGLPAMPPPMGIVNPMFPPSIPAAMPIPSPTPPFPFSTPGVPVVPGFPPFGAPTPGFPPVPGFPAPPVPAPFPIPPSTTLPPTPVVPVGLPPAPPTKPPVHGLPPNPTLPNPTSAPSVYTPPSLSNVPGSRPDPAPAPAPSTAPADQVGEGGEGTDAEKEFAERYPFGARMGGGGWIVYADNDESVEEKRAREKQYAYVPSA